MSKRPPPAPTGSAVGPCPTTVSGHKYLIKFQFSIDLCVFPTLLFIFLWVNTASFYDETNMKIKQNKFYNEYNLSNLIPSNIIRMELFKCDQNL